MIDAHLTEKGIGQAKLVQATWRKEVAKGMPLPKVCIVSPLTRCLQTWTYSLGGLELPEGQAFRPIIKEGIRETFGTHTCDKRSDRSQIAAEFPAFTIEPGLAEKDPLFQAEHRETNSHRARRMLQFLDSLFDPKKQVQPNTKIFEHADPTTSLAAQNAVFISFTAHAGILSALLSVTHHNYFKILPGSMFPTLLRIEKVPGPRVLEDNGPDSEKMVL